MEDEREITLSEIKQAASILKKLIDYGDMNIVANMQMQEALLTLEDEIKKIEENEGE